MLKKPKKGTYGYITAYKKHRGLISVIWILIIAAVYAAGLVIFKTNKNYLTVFAALLVLPGTRAWIASIVMMPYKTQPKKLYDQVVALMQGKQAKVYSDVVLTKYEGSMMLSVVVNYNDNFYAYVPKQKKDTAQIREYLQQMINQTGAETKALVLDNEDRYLTIIKNMAQGADLTSKYQKDLETKLFAAAV